MATPLQGVRPICYAQSHSAFTLALPAALALLACAADRERPPPIDTSAGSGGASAEQNGAGGAPDSSDTPDGGAMGTSDASDDAGDAAAGEPWKELEAACEPWCNVFAETTCVGEPPPGASDVQNRMHDCLQACRHMYGTSCEELVYTFSECAGIPEDVQCDDDGFAVVVGCEAEREAWFECAMVL